MSALHKLGLAFALLAAAGAANAQSDIILDNTSAAFSTIGTWPTSTSTAGYYGTNYQIHAANGIPPAAIAVDNSDPGFSVTGSWPTSTSVSGYYGTNYQVHAANGVPPTAIAADNTDGSAVGTWPTSTSVGGYYGTNYQTHAAGTGANTFTWTLNVATAGTYEVYARWTAYPNRASNAKYTINHSGGSDVVTVDQQATSATWQLLGTYNFDAGAATVSLSDDADGYVIADAVMLEPPGAAPNTATWSMNVPSAGTYNVYARWTAYPNRATDAQFTVNSASGPSTVTVNQQDGAGGQWNLLGTYSFNSGPASVSLTDQADGYVIADAVMLLPPGSPPNSAVWTPNVPQAGQYQVYAWWSAAPNRASNATYTVTNTQGSTPVTVNQQTNGGTWNLLGTYALAPGTTDSITLTDQANGYVIADAIRLVPVQTQAQLYFIEVDHLNTPRLVADATGTTVWRWDQAEPFGDSAANEDPDGNSVSFSFPMRFPGQYADGETNTAYNYYRDYDPSAGRYIESDPIGLRGGVNSYSYVTDSPVYFVDSIGLAKCHYVMNQGDPFDVTTKSHDLYASPGIPWPNNGKYVQCLAAPGSPIQSNPIPQSTYKIIKCALQSVSFRNSPAVINLWVVHVYVQTKIPYTIEQWCMKGCPPKDTYVDTIYQGNISVGNPRLVSTYPGLPSLGGNPRLPQHGDPTQILQGQSNY